MANVNNPKQVKLLLYGGEEVIVRSFITFKLFMEFWGIKEVLKVANKEEVFRELIQNANIIQGFKKEKYKELTSDDLNNILRILMQSFDTNLSEEVSYDTFFFEMSKEKEKIASEMRRTFQPIVKKMQDNIEPLNKALKPLKEASRKIGENLLSLNKTISEAMDLWSESIDSFITEHRKYLEIREEAALIATKYDWFISFDFYIPGEFYSKVIELNGDGNRIDEIFLNSYNHEVIEQMCEDISQTQIGDVYKDFIDELKLCLEMELFRVSIPTMFTMIEGIVARGFNHTGTMNGKEMKDYIKGLFSSSETNTVMEIINKRMLVQFEHGKETDSPISRHAIIHGADISYASKENFIRVFLILYNLIIAFELSKQANND